MLTKSMVMTVITTLTSDNIGVINGNDNNDNDGHNDIMIVRIKMIIMMMNDGDYDEHDESYISIVSTGKIQHIPWPTLYHQQCIHISVIWLGF